MINGTKSGKEKFKRAVFIDDLKLENVSFLHI
jgi:hypothetical protein